jgi:F0F1-type ATP synthase assembly protein I
MQPPSTVALALRAASVFLIVLGLIVAGVAIDALAGSSPVGVLSFMVVGLLFGVIMMIVIIVSAFPRPSARSESPGESDDKSK